MTVETRVINQHTFVRVKTLADQWHTTTSSILATGKPHQIPAKYRRTINRQAWVDVEGLWNRIARAKRPSPIDEQIWAWLLTLPDTGKEYEQLLKDRKEAHRMTPWENGSILVECDTPEQKDIHHALANRQVLWRSKNDRVQVLAQTLSNYLDTRTSSLLAVNKKQGVPAKYIHREWKVTWIDLEGLKKRVEHTEHGSALLKGLKQVIKGLDELTTPDDSRVKLSSVEQKKQAKPKAKPGTKHNPIDPVEVAVEADKRAVHNTERINHLEDRVDVIEAGDKKAVQAMREKHTPLDQLASRVGRLATQADGLDTRTDGLWSRVSVLEDTSKWLSWSLATVLSLRFLGVTLRWLKRK